VKLADLPGEKEMQQERIVPLVERRIPLDPSRR
jgi:hypothetical protein